MPKLEAVGRMDNPEVPDPDAEPLTVTIIGYRAARDARGNVKRDKEHKPIPEEVECEVQFLPMSLAGLTIRSMRMVEAGERMPTSTDAERKARSRVLGERMLSFLNGQIHDDDRVKFEDFVGDPAIEVSFEALAHLYRVLVERYGGGRPTSQRSASHNGRVTPRKTSRGAASSAASGSSRSRSRTRST